MALQLAAKHDMRPEFACERMYLPSAIEACRSTKSMGSRVSRRDRGVEEQFRHSGSLGFGSSVPVRAYAGGCTKEGPIMKIRW